MEYDIYHGRKDLDSVRVYLRGDFYAQISSSGSTIVGEHVYCKESTMTQWGKKITAPAARHLIPDFANKVAAAKAELDAVLAKRSEVDEEYQKQMREEMRALFWRTVSDSELLTELSRRLEERNRSK